GDIKYDNGVTIYDPEDGKAWSINLWSPEIHYFSAEEVGAANAGWYCFLSSQPDDEYLAANPQPEDKAGFGNQRAYVIKCLDGDNLLGRWGNPVTGEVNVPQKLTFTKSGHNEKEFTSGCSVIRVNGQVYLTFVSEVGRETAGTDNPNFYQTINIAKFTNPWTIDDVPAVICVPEYDWEKHGSEDGIHPQVVEGTAGVYGDNGEVFLIYTGSGYWTTFYELGQMKFLGGDPKDVKNWEKKPTPILSKSQELNGCGHACNIIDTNGQGWLVYHAYTGTTTGSGRYAYAEPYYIVDGNVVIGNGSTHPESPKKVYTVPVNSTPIAEKVSGFSKTETVKEKFAYARTYEDLFTDVKTTDWYYSYVKNAYRLKLANGMSATKFAPNDTFTVAQALTVAANIHTAYTGKSVRAAAAGEQWYDPYIEYCVQNGIITASQFKNYTANITRGDMAIVFANILPDSEYEAKREGMCTDITEEMTCYDAVSKLYKAGIVGGDAGTGKYRPGDSLKRSEACVIFSRIAMKTVRDYK
nr:S-layer homology domain-containing protein [Clostridia bacterium]